MPIRLKSEVSDFSIGTAEAGEGARFLIDQWVRAALLRTTRSSF